MLKDTEIPNFLSNRQWVDFRKESDYSESLTYLIKGIQQLTPILQFDQPPKALHEMLNEAKTTLIISGHTLDKFTEQLLVRTAIFKAVRKGVNVILILVNPFCDYSKAHEPFHMLESRSPSYTQIKNSIEALENIFNTTKRPKNLTVLLSNYMPRFRTIIIDNNVAHISLYMYGVDVGDTPEFTLSNMDTGANQRWFGTILTSTQQLINSRNIVPVIQEGIFHQNWQSSKYSFQVKNCLNKKCCTLSDHCWLEIQDSFLGYQNSSKGEDSKIKYHLVDDNYFPGLFTLSDVHSGAKFIYPQRSFG